jgi:hypothetical protein
MRIAHVALWTHDLDGRRNSNAERFRCFDRRGYPAKASGSDSHAQTQPSLAPLYARYPARSAVRRSASIRPIEPYAVATRYVPSASTPAVS